MSEEIKNQAGEPGFGADVAPEVRKSRISSSAADWVQVAREEESSGSRIQRGLENLITRFTEWLRPAAPGELPVPTQLAQALTERVSFHDWLNYRDFDEEDRKSVV